jgi:hypothetical protein
MSEETKRGYLQMCADRRFHKVVEETFQQMTGLKPTDYWIGAEAGGAPGINNSPGADYAYNNRATHMGWAAHGDNCGGFPEVDNHEMQRKLDEAIKNRQERYPKATHYRIFSTEEDTSGWKI